MAVDSRHLRIPLLVIACLLACGVTAASASSGPQNDWQPRGVLDQDVASLAPVASDPGALYAFGGAKAARSTDSGVTWSAPASACIATQGAADPADAEVAYQACQGAGVMRTGDGGQTWTSVSPVDPESPATTPDITGVAVAATTPSTVYAMATSGDRVYRSDDGGQTWGSVTVPALVNPVITADPANAQRLIITGTPTLPNETGMFITTDGGDTWAQLPGSGFKVVFDPTDPARIWADGGTHVDVSTDSGATWGAVPGLPGTPIDIAAAGGDLYVATSAGISRTANDGATWTTAGLPLSSSAAKPAAIAADPAAANRIDVQTQGAGFWSLDYPDSPPASEAYSFFAVDAPSDLTPTSATLSATVAPWFATPASDLPNGVNGDITFSWGSGSGESATAFLDNAESPAQRVLTKTITGLAPGTTYTVSASGEFFVGGSGYGASGQTVSFTTPAAKPEQLNVWHPIWLGPSEITGVHLDPANPAHLEISSSYGYSVSADGGATWSDSASAPCLADMAAATDSSTSDVYAGCSDGLWRSTDGGVNFQPTGLTTNVSAVAVASGAVLAAGQHSPTIERSTDAGATWQTVSLGGSGVVNAIAVDPGNPDNVAVATSLGVTMSTDAGATWSPLAGPDLRQIAFDTSDPTRLWAVSSAAPSLYESTDFGVSWSALPASPSAPSALATLRGVVYVASGHTLFKSTDQGVTWQSAAFGFSLFGTPQITTIAIDPSQSNHVYIGTTDFAGVWDIDFTPDTPAAQPYRAAVMSPVSDLTPTSATISATVAPWFLELYPFGLFSWGPYGAPATATKLVALPRSGSDQLATMQLTGLTPGTTYGVSIMSAASGDPNPTALGTYLPARGITFTTPPALKPEILTPPTAAIASGQVNNGAIPVSVKAVAAAGTYPLAATHLGRKVETGAWTALASGATTLPFGRSYQFRAQAIDTKGQLSPWTNGPAGTLKLKDDAGTQPTWSANWTHHADSTAVDKTIHASSSGTAAVTFKFTGRSVAVIAPRGPHQASFSAVLDGKKVGGIAPSASFLTARRTVAIYSFAKAGAHTLTLHVVRSSGHTLAELDAFAVLS